MHRSPSCTATPKWTWQPCQIPAVNGWTLCRFHGARGGGPQGAAVVPAGTGLHTRPRLSRSGARQRSGCVGRGRPPCWTAGDLHAGDLIVHDCIPASCFRRYPESPAHPAFVPSTVPRAPAIVGAAADGVLITTKPPRSKCRTSRPSVICAIMSSTWWPRFRPSRRSAKERVSAISSGVAVWN